MILCLHIAMSTVNCRGCMPNFLQLEFSQIKQQERQTLPLPLDKELRILTLQLFVLVPSLILQLLVLVPSLTLVACVGPDESDPPWPVACVG